MTTHAIAAQEAMEAKFPAIDDTLRIVGDPNLPKMFNLQKHMIRCARTHRSPLTSANMMFLVLNQQLFANYSTDDYPTEMDDYPDVGATPNYDTATNANERATIKDQWQYGAMLHNDAKNMNAALIARFLQYIEPTYAEAWDNHCTDNSLGSPTYLEMYQFFLDEYGDSDSNDRTANLERMKQPWDPTNGFEKLLHQLHDGIEYAVYAGRPLDADDVVDMAEQLILKTGQYPDIFELWKAEVDQSWTAFKIFWRAKLRLRKQTGLAAGTMGYGMAATQADDEANAALDGAIKEFSAAHLASQATMQNLTDNDAKFKALDQKMDNMVQLVCQMTMANKQAPAVPQQQYYYPIQQQPPQYKKNNNNTNNYNRGYGKAVQFVAGTNMGNGFTQQYAGGNNQRAPMNPVKRFENWNCCDTHGYDIPDDHHSWNCPKPRVGHNYQATRATGCWSKKGMHKTILPSAVGKQAAVTGRQRRMQQQMQQPAMQMPAMQMPAMQAPPMQMPAMQMPPMQKAIPQFKPQQQMPMMNVAMGQQQMQQPVMQMAAPMMQAGQPTGQVMMMNNQQPGGYVMFGNGM